MNIYDKYFEFRLAALDDIPEIIQFLKEEWDENHILVRNRKLFDFQYVTSNNNVNIVVMIDKATKKIVGMNGFVPFQS